MSINTSGLRFVKVTLYFVCTIILIMVGFLFSCVPFQATEPYPVIILFPDTQIEVESYPAVWENMTNWVANNIASKNIIAVIGLGDVTNNDNQTEYNEALTGWNQIDSAGIPYLTILGNHDYDNVTTRTITMWNANFPVSRYSGKSWYGGSENNTTASYYIKFTSGGVNYLLMGLEYFPTTTTLNWAQGIVSANPSYKVIVATHVYLNSAATYILHGDSIGPPSGDFNDGQQMWDNFIKANSNIVAVVGGHCNYGPTSAVRTNAGTYNNLIDQIYIDHQNESYGGNGYMGLLTLKSSTIDMKTYSPYLNAYDSTGAYTMPFRTQ